MEFKTFLKFIDNLESSSGFDICTDLNKFVLDKNISKRKEENKAFFCWLKNNHKDIFNEIKKNNIDKKYLIDESCSIEESINSGNLSITYIFREFKISSLNENVLIKLKNDFKDFGFYLKVRNKVSFYKEIFSNELSCHENELPFLKMLYLKFLFETNQDKLLKLYNNTIFNSLVDLICFLEDNLDLMFEVDNYFLNRNILDILSEIKNHIYEFINNYKEGDYFGGNNLFSKIFYDWLLDKNIDIKLLKLNDVENYLVQFIKLNLKNNVLI